MKYFVTIYIDPLFDFEGFTHAFLGLTDKTSKRCKILGL